MTGRSAESVFMCLGNDRKDARSGVTGITPQNRKTLILSSPDDLMHFGVRARLADHHHGLARRWMRAIRPAINASRNGTFRRPRRPDARIGNGSSSRPVWANSSVAARRLSSVAAMPTAVKRLPMVGKLSSAARRRYRERPRRAPWRRAQRQRSWGGFVELFGGSGGL